MFGTRALQIFRKDLQEQIYSDGQFQVRKEIVHNRHVVEELRSMGTVFVDELSEVPEGARVIYSAHGVSPVVRSEAKLRNLDVIDDHIEVGDRLDICER